ncbi:hypothetical protein [Legionella gresilensis]|uniref:hypothetical protein n=1 Tax=Legionella gresilensis TaxID=91823 RepID=UPI001041A082|nr:hypothetical protein [Legionella gresilensis]
MFDDIKDFLNKGVRSAHIISHIYSQNKKLVEVVNLILENKECLTNDDEINRFSSFLFDLALVSKKAANALLKDSNHLIQAIPFAVGEEKLLEFATKYPHLVLDLLKKAGIKDAQLIQKMCENAQLEKPQEELRQSLQPGPDDDLLEAAGRTQKAIVHNKRIIDRGGIKGIIYGNEFIPMVTRKTRNFNQQLCSIGSSNSREVILLDSNAQELKDLYKQLRRNIKPNSDINDILTEIQKLTRSCFPKGNPEIVMFQYFHGIGTQNIPLTEFIKQKQGVCRHHTLLNAYFLSRLVEDKILSGDIIHHRQDFLEQGGLIRGAHTWNLFYNHKDRKLYSLDSLWENITCITDQPGDLNRLYKATVESVIQKKHPEFFLENGAGNQRKAEFNSSPPNINYINNPKASNLSTLDRVKNIKAVIEKEHFTLSSFLFFKGGKTEESLNKRLPHRIYDIYQDVKDTNINEAEAQALLGNIVKRAKDAIDNPRPGQASGTTNLYKQIIAYAKCETDNLSSSEVIEVDWVENNLTTP